MKIFRFLLRFSLVVSVLCIILTTNGQENKTINGVKDNRLLAYAFTNATIHTNSIQTIKNGTLLVKEGRIQAVGTNINIPKEYVIYDLMGQHVYPSFIDLHSSIGLPQKEPKPFNWNAAEVIENPDKSPGNTLGTIRPEFAAVESIVIKEKEAKALRDLGFGVVLSHNKDGLVRGTGVLLTLANDDIHKVILSDKASQHFSFKKGSSTQMYPFSTMGFIAAIRQTYLDAEWYKQFDKKQNLKPFTDISLSAFNQQQGLPQIFETKNWLETLRAHKIAKEFGVTYIYKTGGNSYQRIDQIKNINSALIVPLTYPKAPKITSPMDAQTITLKQLQEWEHAPTNLKIIHDKGITFAITLDGITPKDFKKNLLAAIEQGISKEVVLKALTETPASLINRSSQLGSISKGKLANFFITDLEYFDKNSKVKNHIIQGLIHNPIEINKPLASGLYDFKFNKTAYTLALEENAKMPGSFKANLKEGDSTLSKVNLTIKGDEVTLIFKDPKNKKAGDYFLSGFLNDKQMNGKGFNGDSPFFSWTAQYQSVIPKKENKTMAGKKTDSGKKKEESKKPLSPVNYPMGMYGLQASPDSKSYLIQNARLWTNTDQGILEETDILLKDGKIAAIGKNLKASGATIINGKGMQVTPGIIDEHTHIAATSINDVAVNSGMVRIGDVIDPTDINIYRQLAGGVTAAQILHGSANPIGGQSALIKFRWGANPEEMKIKGADGFIKFALGENVKRSRSASSIRYPQTRMGVEQVYEDAFSSAVAYKNSFKKYYAVPAKKRGSLIKPRRDLAQETMQEIIDSKRFISCHSYVQSEINMLMHVAERYNFRVNTFTHILEGYKVADKMADHGVSGSTFADWWAYKWEVRYAIPYNAALMTEAGVNVAINSDDAEMARRLNQEAGKSLKYGGMKEEDALKMVTLNPAKMLHLDNRMGSLKVGMDADIVVWNNHPLSVYAQAMKTFVDGKLYFDRESSQQVFEEHEALRKRLIQKARESGKGQKAPTIAPTPKIHCDHLTEIQY